MRANRSEDFSKLVLLIDFLGPRRGRPSTVPAFVAVLFWEVTDTGCWFMGCASLSQIPLPHTVLRGRCQHAAPLLKLHNEISWYPLVKQLFDTSQPTLCSLAASAGGCSTRTLSQHQAWKPYTCFSGTASTLASACSEAALGSAVLTWLYWFGEVMLSQHSPAQCRAELALSWLQSDTASCRDPLCSAGPGAL